ncbi:DUF1329 domain-containing protein [Paraburkholderia sp. MM5384-R2]|uniref:DUF1329 domain-containing protein n=1 Tax=Paraburkholderia sp. MM5384-R2 TaxID=2723097 RepID=UPI00161C1381|nr:DUF1329 domain-containing protein [Paraburkholderia sp. MM5384-R2]MBB5497598.1 hypothetical protein [Paraburkholderia sp. MM5384-R2]
MEFQTLARVATVLFAVAVVAPAQAAVTADEAAHLKSDLTPFGAEKAGNKDGTIPAWTGGLTTPTPGFKSGGRRPDPFANEKPILQITAKNMDQYADKLAEGVKALLKKYPDSYRLDVYPTHRSAAAPQYVYDNTFQNATRVTLSDSSAGPVPKGGYGGIPFPIPKNGAEVMLNHKLRWRSESWVKTAHNWQVTADGKPVLLSDVTQQNNTPYYFKDAPSDKRGDDYWMVRLDTHGPAIRAGEAIIGHQTIDESNTNTWVYLVGQRRVRKLPNACCDTPTPAAAGVLSFDEIETFNGRMDRFDWKLIGKKEMYIPYNSNRVLTAASDSDILGAHHLNPDYIRWELHRVWVVEATLKSGERHTSKRSVYYVDEDSWLAVLADRYDANDKLWRMAYSTPVAMPDVPGEIAFGFGAYDLSAGSYVAMELGAEQKMQYKVNATRYPESFFAPENMAGESVR